jgi:hypothetical protein
MAALLLRARTADRPDLHPTRVELFDQALNGAALARGVPAFEHDDAAPPLDPVDLLELDHCNLQFAQPLQIARLVRQSPIEIELGQPEPRFNLYRRYHVTTRIAQPPAVRILSVPPEKVLAKNDHVLF